MAPFIDPNTTQARTVVRAAMQRSQRPEDIVQALEDAGLIVRASALPAPRQQQSLAERALARLDATELAHGREAGKDTRDGGRPPAGEFTQASQPLDAAQRLAARQFTQAVERLDAPRRLVALQVETAAKLRRAADESGTPRLAMRTIADEIEAEVGNSDHCNLPPNRRLACGHCLHETCPDCTHCPCGCHCTAGGAQ